MDDSLSFASHTPWVATVATPPASLHSDAAHFVVPRSHEQQKTAKGGPAVHQFLGLKSSHTLELSIHILGLALPQTFARNCGKTIPSSGLTGFHKWTGYLAASVPRILATSGNLGGLNFEPPAKLKSSAISARTWNNKMINKQSSDDYDPDSHRFPESRATGSTPPKSAMAVLDTHNFGSSSAPLRSSGGRIPNSTASVLPRFTCFSK